MSAQIIPAIMCGGAGTRLWPVSRESMPKQFVPLIGERSTFQQVLARISHPALFARPIVITNADFRFIVAEQLREQRHRSRHRAGAEPPRFRPGRRGRRRACSGTRSRRTGAGAGRRPCRPRRRGISRGPAEHAAAGRERRAASSRSASRPPTPRRVTATSARERSSMAASCACGRRIRREAGCRDRRELCGERYLWNSGNFLFHADIMLGEIERFEPAMAEAAKAAVDRAHPRSRFPAACSRAVRARAQEVDRLRGHGAHQARRRRARRFRLVRCRQLGARSGTSSITTPPAMRSRVQWSCWTAATAWCARTSPC